MQTTDHHKTLYTDSLTKRTRFTKPTIHLANFFAKTRRIIALLMNSFFMMLSLMYEDFWGECSVCKTDTPLKNAGFCDEKFKHFH